MTADRPPVSGEPSTERVSECIFCGPEHPNGLRHSNAEIRAYERGLSARATRAEPPGLSVAVEALRAITRTVYSDDAPLDSPSYSSLHLQAVGIARDALARLAAPTEDGTS